MFETQTSQESLQSNLVLTLHQAATHHQAGELTQAEQLYRALLIVVPEHADAHYNLGLLAMQRHQPAEALPHFEIALQANPVESDFWLAYIEALIQTGALDSARQVLETGQQHGLEGKVAEALAERLNDGT